MPTIAWRGMLVSSVVAGFNPLMEIDNCADISSGGPGSTTESVSKEKK